jgi:hypothetical protein
MSTSDEMDIWIEATLDADPMEWMDTKTRGRSVPRCRQMNSRAGM